MFIDDGRHAFRRLRSQPGASFSAISLIAATGGLFSILAYAVRHRRREFGIRLALGASPVEVRRIVFREGARVAAAGLMLGSLAGWWISQWLSALTFGIPANDVSTWLLVTAVIGLTVVTASWRPASQASRIDPATLLRE